MKDLIEALNDGSPKIPAETALKGLLKTLRRYGFVAKSDIKTEKGNTRVQFAGTFKGERAWVRIEYAKAKTQTKKRAQALFNTMPAMGWEKLSGYQTDGAFENVFGFKLFMQRPNHPKFVNDYPSGWGGGLWVHLVVPKVEK